MREAINSLRSSSTTCRLSGPMAYRLVSSLAEFDPDYHCIDEVLFDSEHYEAVCLVSFGQVKHHSDSGPLLFHTSPAAIDGLTQSAGFVMNANDRTKLDTSVFVNHGWKDLQLFEPIRDDCQYYTHVVMTEGEEQVWSGDISIFTEDRVVGVVKGVQVCCFSVFPRGQPAGTGVLSPRKYIVVMLDMCIDPRSSSPAVEVHSHASIETSKGDQVDT